MKPSVLVAGFRPFGGQALNSSGEVVAALAGSSVAAAVLPVTYRGAADALLRAVERVEPAAVVLFGQAEGASAIRVERVARNLVASDAPDEEGAVLLGLPVLANAPAAYATGLPRERILARLAAAGIPAVESDDAGGYVCNHAFFGLMHRLAGTPGVTAAGLVHLPILDEQRAAPEAPAMSRSMLVRAAETVVAAVA